MSSKLSTHYVLHLGSYPPRECGIATFTQDLVSALNKKFNPVVKTRIAALDDQPTSMYNYDHHVLYHVPATELEHYVNLAHEINRRDDVKLLNIQHEFGLFGGDFGDYLIPFLQVIEKPVIVTLHTVLANPHERMLSVMREIALRVKKLVVMNSLSADILERDYRIPKSKIVLIPHGIPQVSFEPSDIAKEKVGLSNRFVLSTFGMLSVNKGIEYAIRALPSIVKKHPDVIYLILGATHPNIQRQEGERYRNFLMNEVDRLQLNNHVRFYNKYLTLDEIKTFLQATDIYLSSSIDQAQSVSGSLSYAVGCGRPVISSGTSYAKFLIDKTNGILVPPRNHHAIARGLLHLLNNPRTLKSMNAQAYEKSRRMIWPNVAVQYFNLYKKHSDLGQEEKKLPELRLSHLMRLTDTFGIMHHAKYSKPEKRYGYSLDDNARALIVCARLFQATKRADVSALITTYLRFIKFVQRPSGTFANIVSSTRHKDGTVDEDVLGRAVWALGIAGSHDALPEAIRTSVITMLRTSLPHISKLESPRAIAFSLIGLYFFLKAQPLASVRRVFEKLSARQADYYTKYAASNWQWFEDQLTYSNSKLSESMYYAYQHTNNKRYLKIAETSLNFLSNITFLKKYYAPIGQHGWYFRYQKRSYFDQQPEDAASMVETKLVAYAVTGHERHLDDAHKAFQWFLGRNHLSQMVYDEVTGGCHDGLGKDGVNLNQGAESTLSYLLARVSLEDPKLLV